MHAILAVSASHLRRLEPSVSSHRLAEVDHWHQALAKFQKELQTPMRQDNCDSVLLTSMLLNLMSFAYIESRDPRDSWVFSNAHDRLDWLNIQLGLVPLLINSRPFREGSLLGPLFASHEIGEFSGASSFASGPPCSSIPLPLVDMESGLAHVCGLHLLERPAESPYYQPLRCLLPMLGLPRTLDHLFTFANFIAHIHDDFLGLLQRSDERALLIFGHWLGLMCGIEKWWCEDRVRRDCRAICMFLEERGSPEVRAMTDWMAWACGYVSNVE